VNASSSRDASSSNASQRPSTTTGM
jgi:hypothetical protein